LEHLETDMRDDKKSETLKLAEQTTKQAEQTTKQAEQTTKQAEHTTEATIAEQTTKQAEATTEATIAEQTTKQAEATTQATIAEQKTKQAEAAAETAKEVTKQAKETTRQIKAARDRAKFKLERTRARSDGATSDGHRSKRSRGEDKESTTVQADDSEASEASDSDEPWTPPTDPMDSMEEEVVPPTTCRRVRIGNQYFLRSGTKTSVLVEREEHVERPSWPAEDRVRAVPTVPTVVRKRCPDAAVKVVMDLLKDYARRLERDTLARNMQRWTRLVRVSYAPKAAIVAALQMVTLPGNLLARAGSCHLRPGMLDDDQVAELLGSDDSDDTTALLSKIGLYVSVRKVSRKARRLLHGVADSAASPSVVRVVVVDRALISGV
jgi:chemotaxis protein histidine kinase CheA